MKNKKNLLLVLVIIFIVAIISIFFMKNITNNNNITIEKEYELFNIFFKKKINIIIEKGYELFGNEYCKGHNHQGFDFPGWIGYSICKICGFEKHTDIPDSDFIICTKCAKIAGRCSKCGKLLGK